MTLYKNIYFWVATAVLLVVIGFSVMMLLPPTLTKLQENRDQIAQLKEDLVKQEKYLAAVQAIEQDETELNALYDKAVLALPDKSQSEILMLQFDGLLADLGIGNATLDIPLVIAAPTSQEQAAATPSNATSVTITGDISYETFLALLRDLKTFSRWNRVSAFDLSKTGDAYSTTLTTQAFHQPGAVGEFSGDENIISKAAQVFSGLTSYAATPDIASEGSYGKANPFNP